MFEMRVKLYILQNICTQITQKFFQQAYQLATKEFYSYLFVDLTPTCPDEIRFDPEFFQQTPIMSTNQEYK